MGLFNITVNLIISYLLKFVFVVGLGDILVRQLLIFVLDLLFLFLRVCDTLYKYAYVCTG